MDTDNKDLKTGASGDGDQVVNNGTDASSQSAEEQVVPRKRFTTEDLLRLGAYSPDQKSRDGIFVPESFRSQY